MTTEQLQQLATEAAQAIDVLMTYAYDSGQYQRPNRLVDVIATVLREAVGTKPIQDRSTEDNRRFWDGIEAVAQEGKSDTEQHLAEAVATITALSQEKEKLTRIVEIERQAYARLNLWKHLRRWR